MTNKIQERFGQRRVLLPVVYCIDADQVRRAVDTAMDAGADGVFLLHEDGMFENEMVELAGRLREDVPFVGLRVGSGVASALTYAVQYDLDGIWAGQYGVAAWPKEKRKVRWPGLFFGGVAGGRVGTGVDVARTVAADVDVVALCGRSSGEPPTVDDICMARSAVGKRALAVVSGVTPENVGAFLPHVDAFLPLKEVETSLGVFDPAKVRALADAVHA